MAEQTGLISALDDRVLELACSRVSSWRLDEDLADLSLSLNRSVRDITRPSFYERIRRALAESGLPPSALTIEITETVLLDAKRSSLVDLRRLYDEGVAVAIDDWHRIRLAQLLDGSAHHLHQDRPQLHKRTAR